ncbi:acyltransferase [Pyruvatibacter sp.]|uniref:acyltransferase family protein n=1 Tax=Pyruvatibacter sp. TaxID=1981328 RepID=UPI0032EBEA68
MINFDALRIIASIGIVWHHSHFFFYTEAARPEIIARTQSFALFVDLFFIISGYVITFLYKEKITSSSKYSMFMRKRVARLLPLHWLTFLVSFAVWTLAFTTGTQINNPPSYDLVCITSTVFLIHAMVPCGGEHFNGVSWSVSAEMVMYVVFPLVMLLARRRALFSSAVLALLVTAFALQIATGWHWKELHPLVRAMIGFSFGTGLMLYRTVLLRVPVPRWALLALVAALCIEMQIGVHDAIVMLNIYILCIFAVAADARREHPLIFRIIAPLGQLTYSLYMWHPIAILIVMNAIGDKILGWSGSWHMIALSAFCYSFCLALAYLSWAWFEGPSRLLIAGRKQAQPLRGGFKPGDS